MWRVLAITLAAMLGVVSAGFAIQAVMLTDMGWHFDSDSLRDWVSAAGTPVAATAAVIATLGYRLDSRSRRSDDARRIEAGKRKQAELISGWTQREEENEANKLVVVGLANASDGVVYRLQIQLTCAPIADNPSAVYKMQELRAHGYLAELPPGKWMVQLELGSPNMKIETLRIYFHDQNQVRWGRDTLGRLDESPPQPFPLPPLQGPWPYEATALTEWQRSLGDSHSPNFVPIQLLERAQV